VIKVETSETVAKIFFVVIGFIFIIIGIFIPKVKIEEVREMFPIDLSSVPSTIFTIMFKTPWYIMKIFLILVGLFFIILMGMLLTE
jgi:hypothetical protein